jgi:hypothetical protein
MAQLSYVFDTFVFGYYFNATQIPTLLEYIESDVYYTLRVIAAWWVIKQLWDWIGNYWVSVFLGAELTFIVDYFIFQDLYIIG